MLVKGLCLRGHRRWVMRRRPRKTWGSQRSEQREHGEEGKKRKSKFENGHSEIEQRGKTLRWCRDPSTPCRILRGTAVGMTDFAMLHTARDCGRDDMTGARIPKTQVENRTWRTRVHRKDKDYTETTEFTEKRTQDAGKKSNLGHPGRRKRLKSNQIGRA